MTTVPLGPIWNTFDHPGYNCSRTMEAGLAWNKVHSWTQTAFGCWSIFFGVAAEVLYLPCMLALRKERNSCYRIMYALSINDMLTIPVSSIIFGVGLIMGEVYCSHPTFHFFLGAFGLGGHSSWCCASMIVLILASNRVAELLNKAYLFKGVRTTIFLYVSLAYGLAVGLFTPPPMLNSQFQSYFFNPFISFTEQYVFVNWFHAINNIAVVFFSSSMYAFLCIILIMKQGAMGTEQGRKRMRASYSVFLQAGLIMSFNMVSSSIYVYMNFFYTPLWLVQVAQLMWQFAQGMPPVIYLGLNQTIRRYTANMLSTDSAVTHVRHESLARSRKSER
ncbi:hypothetical protein PMAYCL1PPCAC_17341, partial [Pristionchus mayeri]